jgi:hypothetical protein
MRLEGVIVAEVLLATMASSEPARADPVTQWNEITFATQAAAVPSGVRTPVAARALAMVHLAIFDAVNSIDRRFAPYAVAALADPSASPEAATDAAAHAVLVSLYPSRRADLDSAYDAALSSIAPGPARTKGILVGESVAGVILARRAFDGSDINAPYTQLPGPGIYQPDPAALWVAWGDVAPFALRSGSQFRAEGPPPLASEEYAADYNEVRSIGALNSLTRTPDQTAAALFWMENAQITWNAIARIAVTAAHSDLFETAHVFALMNMAGADTTIAVMDSKYTYNFWRPREAIHAGDVDGNDDTAADPTWTPLGYIGVHPDYVSQHAAYGAAAATVLASVFGKSDVGFMLTTSTSPGGGFRAYSSFWQAALENMNSRVWLGAHFRTACRHGLNQGKQVGNFVVHHYLRPTK